MKKYIVLIALCIISFESFSQVTFRLSEEIVGENKDTVVNLYATDFNNAMSFFFAFEWDDKVVNFTEIVSMELNNLSKENISNPSSSQNRIEIAWNTNDLINGTSMEDEFKVASFRFQAVGEDGEQTSLVYNDIPFQPLEFYILNGNDFEEIGIDFETGSITIDTESNTSEILDINDVKIFPNPVGDFLEIAFKESLFGVTMQINFNDVLSGKTVSNQTLKYDGGNFTFDTSKFVSGFYTISILTEKGFYSLPFIKY